MLFSIYTVSLWQLPINEHNDDDDDDDDDDYDDDDGDDDVSKTGPIRLIWHNFTNSQYLPMIVGRETDLIQYGKSFFKQIGLEPAA